MNRIAIFKPISSIENDLWFKIGVAQGDETEALEFFYHLVVLGPDLNTVIDVDTSNIATRLDTHYGIIALLGTEKAQSIKVYRVVTGLIKEVKI